MEDALRGHFYTSPGTDGWLLSNLNAGMTDSSVARLIPQVLLLGIFRLVAFFYRRQFASIINKCKKKRDAQEQRSKGT